MILPEKYNYLDINPDFEKALNLITTTNKNLFITGPAGSGKSTLLKIIMDDAVLAGNKVLLASTGVASMNASSEEFKGSTIHSFLKLPPLTAYSRGSIDLNDKVKAVASKVDIVIIDEVSMMNASLFDIIEYLFKIYKDGESPRYFLFGDPFQLPPVMDKKETNVMRYFNDIYDGNVFFFNSYAFKDLGIETIHLNKIYRQKEGSFQNILNRLRQGIYNPEDLKILNDRVLSETDFIMESEDDYIYLASTNKVVTFMNENKLAFENGLERSYHAHIEGNFDPQKKKMIDQVVTLREGCQVLVTANSGPESPSTYYNGLLGTVQSLYSDSAIIRVKGGILTVCKNKWNSYDYTYDEVQKAIVHKISGSMSQLALKLAYALTIHKSQGLTLDRAYIDLGWEAFSDGLTYVALSRLRDITGLGLKRKLKPEDIKVSREVIKFFETI